jgi:hypothetical protein
MKTIDPRQGGDIWDRLRIEYLFFPDKIYIYFLFSFQNMNPPWRGIEGSISQHRTPLLVSCCWKKQFNLGRILCNYTYFFCFKLNVLNIQQPPDLPNANVVKKNCCIKLYYQLITFQFLAITESQHSKMR